MTTENQETSIKTAAKTAAKADKKTRGPKLTPARRHGDTRKSKVYRRDYNSMFYINGGKDVTNAQKGAVIYLSELLTRESQSE
jgi:hypothetical protein